MMGVLNELDINDISNLYVMYNELVKINYSKRTYEKVLLYYSKALKYFEILYSKLDTPSTNPELLENLKAGFAQLNPIADSAVKELNYDIFNPELMKNEIDKYEQVLFSSPNKQDAFNKITMNLYNDNAFISALNFWKLTMNFSPDDYNNYTFLGHLYNKINNLQMAISAYETYNEHCEKKDAVVNTDIGALYLELDKEKFYDKAIEYFKKAVEIDPNYIDAVRYLAFTYRGANDFENSSKYFDILMTLNPTNDDICNYGHLKLKCKDFKEGFKYLSTRFDRGELSTPRPQINKPELIKAADCEGKILLVHYEQGFGDTIQFCRYLNQLKAKKIIFKVQDCLVDLIKSNVKNVDEVVAESEPISDLTFDYYVLLMNLPQLLNATVENIPFSEGYIKADDEKINEYKKQFFNNDNFKIGIAWHGATKGAVNRNIKPSSFYLLSKLQKTQIYSLQKGFDSDLTEIPQDFNLINLGDTFNDFSDTAAAIANLDLIITTDNVIANLAGAMGKKTFLLLFEDSDWRWFFNDETTPWYESVKIFRSKNNFESISKIVQNIINELSE